MFAGNQSGRNGMIAGGIAMLIALATVELISWAIAPWQLLTDYAGFMAYSRTAEFTGELAWWLRGGGPQFARFVMTVVVVCVLVGAGLGRWVSENSVTLGQRAMQAAAIVLFATLVLWYIGDSFTLEHYLQEIAITLALSCLVYALVMNWLLQDGSNETRWRISGVVAFLGFAFILSQLYIF